MSAELVAMASTVSMSRPPWLLSLRPAVIEESQIVPVTWVCGNAKAPDKMTLKGENRTNVATEFLPMMCR